MNRARTAVAVVTMLLAGVLAACTSGSLHRDVTATGRPNIVYVLTDDLSMNLLPYLPRVLAMQHDGLTMSHFYTVDSLCCPSRSAIFTGLYPHDDGVFTNTGSDGGYGAFQKNGNPAKTFAVSLQKAGYRTGFMGKYINGYDPTKDAVPPGWSDWVGAGEAYPEFDYTLNENGKQVRYGHAPADYLTDVMAGKGAAFITSSAAKKQPFFLEVATFAPHFPYTPAPRYANSDPDVKYPRTAAFDTLPTDPPNWLRGRTPLLPVTTTKIDHDFRLRVQADRAVDDLIGTLQAALRKAGVDRNTYVVFGSDNGYHMGEYRLSVGKETAYDTDIHVPLVVTGPDVPAGRSVDQLGSTIDLAPTFDAIAGATPHPGIDGVSELDLWHGRTPDSWRKAVLIEHHHPAPDPNDPDRQTSAQGSPPTYVAVRTADALLVRYPVKKETEYYDTRTDPDEIHNLGGAAPSALRATLLALSRCHGAKACQKAAGAG